MRRVIVFDGQDESVAGRTWAPYAALAAALGKAKVVTSRPGYSTKRADIDETQFWGHGGKHGVYYDGAHYNPPEFMSMLAFLGALPRRGGVIWIRACGVGNKFASDLAVITGCKVVCFSHTIWLFQGRLKSFNEVGEQVTGKGDVDSSTKWTTPFMKRTILATQIELPKGIV